MDDALENETTGTKITEIEREQRPIEEREKRKEREELDELTENIFLNSLKDLKEEDIDLNEAAKNAKKPPVDLLRYFIMAVCLSIFVYTGYIFIDQLFQYAQAASDNYLFRDMFHGSDPAEQINSLGDLRRARANRPIQDMLSLQRQTVREIDAVTHEGIGEDEQARLRGDQRRRQFERLRETMPSIYGWLRVSGTNIDYPVVQSHGNDGSRGEFYLRRNPRGESLTAGSLFADYRNDRNVDNNLNTIIYGHNMFDRTKFNNLMMFRHNRELFNTSLIELTTPDGIYVYEVFSAHEAHELFFFRETEFRGRMFYVEELGEYVQFCDDEWFVFWLNMMRDLSVFRNNRVVFTPESRIITLQTCINTALFPTQRWVVHGVLIDVIR